MSTHSVIETPAPLDSRVSGLPPDRQPEPAPPLRLTMAPESEDDELRHMRTVLRHYMRKFGGDVVLRAVQQIASESRS